MGALSMRRRPPTHLIGRRFNRLVVIGLEPSRLPGGKSCYKAHVRCDCGTESRIFVTSLQQRRTGSCGCDKSRYAKTTGAKNYAFKGYQEIRLSYWNIIRARARSRGIHFDLTIESTWALYEKQQRVCALSGVPIHFGVNAGCKPSNTTASLDRIDNSKGYVEGNVQWVHKRVNIMRNTLTIREFLEWCQSVVSHEKSSHTVTLT